MANHHAENAVPRSRGLRTAQRLTRHRFGAPLTDRHEEAP